LAPTSTTTVELYERLAPGGDAHGTGFRTAGAMGHSRPVAVGVARARPDRRVLCLDGDGSVLMHMGALAIIGQSGLGNLVHVVVNNGAHDSVGGQPTAGFEIDLVAIAKACGYRAAASVSAPAEIGPA